MRRKKVEKVFPREFFNLGSKKAASLQTGPTKIPCTLMSSFWSSEKAESVPVWLLVDKGLVNVSEV